MPVLFADWDELPPPAEYFEIQWRRCLTDWWTETQTVEMFTTLEVGQETVYQVRVRACGAGGCTEWEYSKRRRLEDGTLEDDEYCIRLTVDNEDNDEEETDSTD